MNFVFSFLIIIVILVDTRKNRHADSIPLARLKCNAIRDTTWQRGAVFEMGCKRHGLFLVPV